MLKNDFVFALIGYHPDFEFLDKRWACAPRAGPHAGLRFRLPGKQCAGIYLAGVIVAGARTNEIFIENGRFHGGRSPPIWLRSESVAHYRHPSRLKFIDMISRAPEFLP
jgi:hypothetical protein